MHGDALARQGCLPLLGTTAIYGRAPIRLLDVPSPLVFHNSRLGSMADTLQKLGFLWN